MSFDKNWEANIYSDNKHINKYPYGELVSILFNSQKYLKTLSLKNQTKKLLELGCGTGNNLWFMEEIGYDVFAIDGSQSACNIAIKENKKRSCTANIQCATFDNLPYDNDFFDIIIDRESTYCGLQSDIKNWWQEVNRVLKKGGVIISFKFSDKSPDLLKIKNNEIIATKLEENTYTNVQTGSFKGTGIVHFSTYEELFDIFDFCEIKYINNHSSKTIYTDQTYTFQYDEYIIVGVKK